MKKTCICLAMATLTLLHVGKGISGLQQIWFVGDGGGTDQSSTDIGELQITHDASTIGSTIPTRTSFPPTYWRGQCVGSPPYSVGGTINAYFRVTSAYPSTTFGGHPGILLSDQLGLQMEVDMEAAHVYVPSPNAVYSGTLPTGTTDLQGNPVRPPTCDLRAPTIGENHPINLIVRAPLKGHVDLNFPAVATYAYGDITSVYQHNYVSYSLTGSITAPSNCTIDPQTIPIQLDDIPSAAFLTGGVGNVPSGVTSKTYNVKVHCKDGDITTAPISMTLSGQPALDYPQYLHTSNKSIGVKVMDESRGTILRPGDSISYQLDSTGDASVPISFAPIFIGNGTPISGTYSAVSSLITTYP